MAAKRETNALVQQLRQLLTEIHDMADCVSVCRMAEYGSWRDCRERKESENQFPLCLGCKIRKLIDEKEV